MEYQGFNIGDRVNANGSSYQMEVVGFVKVADEFQAELRRVHPESGELESGRPLVLPTDGLTKTAA